MQKTKNYKLRKPDRDDYVEVGDFNFNFEELDKLIKDLNTALEAMGAGLTVNLSKKADLDDRGKVVRNQLPDLDEYKDVLFYNAKGNFPTSGDAKKLYIDKQREKIYRWNGSSYIEISKSLDIGEITGTAFDGARGKALEDEMAKRYTKAEVDEILRKLKIEINSNIIEQILAYS